jgi:pyridoxal phosphate enzyme (YggS family)
MVNSGFLSNFKHPGVKIVAVSKTKTTDQILEIYNAGHRDFGENKVQELSEKAEKLPKDIKWHMIGHLQSNKVKYIAPFIYLIHSVDSVKLLKTIDKEARKNNRIINVLLQVRIAEEDTKFGMEAEDLYEIVEDFNANLYPNVKICGLMGMATFTDDLTQIEREFERLHDIFIEMKVVYFTQAYYFKELSMGMSGDYELAIEHGATLVRIGTLIFGRRNT